MNDRFADLDESAAWNDAVNRRDAAVRVLERFAATHAEHRIACLQQALRLKMTPVNDWPLGTRGEQGR